MPKKLSNLIAVLADVLKMPETTIEAYAKPLRKNGLISSGGRGPGSADMTPKDCSNLLIACMAGSPAQAVENLNAFSCAEKFLAFSRQQAVVGQKLLTYQVTFGRAVEQIITASANSNTDDVLRKIFIQSKVASKDTAINPHIEISITTPITSAQISLQAIDVLNLDNIEDVNFYFSTPIPDKTDDYSDKYVTVTVGRKTISALGKLLAE